MNRSLFYLVSLASLLPLGGCSAREDSLTREKASMEAEAKAMAAHDSKPKSGAQPPPAADPLIRKPAAASGGVKLPAGTMIHVVTTQSLSTRSATIGQDWTGQLAADVKDGTGKLLAKAGSDIKGRVVLVADGTQLRRKHELELRLYRIQTVNGSPLDVRTSTVIVEGQDRGARPAVIETNAKLDFQLSSETTFPE